MTSVLSLPRRNRNFRLLWFGQVVSQLGDWFSLVALYGLLFELTGSATAVASMMVMQMLPQALVSPSAGVVVDRYDRRRIMIAADLVRGVVILGLLFVRTPSMVWLAYAVIAVVVAAQGFFEPARSALVPSLVERDELVAANAIATGTWSAMLAIGASLGGGVAVLFGRNAAFVLNSVSFFASAAFLYRMRVPAREPEHKDDSGWHGLIEGFRYMRAHRPVVGIALVKSGWAIVGGALLLLTVFGDRVFRIGDTGDAGIGVLYAARGIGAAVGSLSVAYIARRSSGALVPWIGPCYVLAGACYAMLGIVPTIWAAAIAVVVAHVFGSLLWVSSNVLLQMAVPDRFRGRVFAAELMLLSIVQSIIAFLTAQALDRWRVPPRTMAVVVGLSLWIPALLWYVFARPGLDRTNRMDRMER